MVKQQQLKPTKKLIFPTDKLSKEVFNVTIPKNKDDFVNTLIEDKRLKLTTQYYLEPMKGDLNQFDRAIFCVACSEYLAGNTVFTINRLFKRIGGGVNLTDNMKKIVSDSVNKLACTRFIADVSKLSERLPKSDKTKFTFKNYLLPVKSVEFELNGMLVDTSFEFLDMPPLLEIAELKKQFIPCDVKLLDIPTLKTTEQTVKISSYLLERVLMIIGSHQKHPAHIVGKSKDNKPICKKATALEKKILLDSLYTQCGLADADKGKKRDARNVIKKVMEHFQALDLISDWHFEEKDGNKFYAIIFDWKQHRVITAFSDDKLA